MTQCEKIHRHLQDYGSITPVEALREYGVMRLAARIKDLKSEAFPSRAGERPVPIATDNVCGIACIRWR